MEPIVLQLCFWAFVVIGVWMSGVEVLWVTSYNGQPVLLGVALLSVALLPPSRQCNFVHSIATSQHVSFLC